MRMHQAGSVSAATAAGARLGAVPRLDHNWFLGSDHVYDRYRLHAKRSAASRSVQPRAAIGPPDGCFDLAELEVWRACQPYGLAHQEHRVALRSLYVAISLHYGRTLQLVEGGWTG
jgi:hypothetical protein